MNEPEKIGIISTWRKPCGIATYTEAYCQLLKDFKITIFSENGEVQGQQYLAYEESDSIDSVECWSSNGDEDFKQLKKEIAESGIKRVIVQHQPGLIKFKKLGSLRWALTGCKVSVVIHAVPESLSEDVIKELNRFYRIVVHSRSAEQRMINWGVDTERLKVVAHGVYNRPGSVTPGSSAGESICTFGLLNRHKNLGGLIKAFQESEKWNDLALYTCLLENEENRTAYNAIKPLLGNGATIDIAFKKNDEIIKLMSQHKFAVFNAGRSQESASGSIRMAIAAGLPIMCSDSEIFDEICDDVPAIIRFSSETPEVSSPFRYASLKDALNNVTDEELKDCQKSCDDYYTKHRFSNLEVKICSALLR